ncbi:hypothetical protein Sjap_018506 [Stephania japonica]|uniref:Uncharacterized protein n=1 Tax=Stephania japonica TaxID=461633 RepID=A0AAP0I8W8_9MAGN
MALVPRRGRSGVFPDLRCCRGFSGGGRCAFRDLNRRSGVRISVQLVLRRRASRDLVRSGVVFSSPGLPIWRRKGESIGRGASFASLLNSVTSNTSKEKSSFDFWRDFWLSMVTGAIRGLLIRVDAIGWILRFAFPELVMTRFALSPSRALTKESFMLFEFPYRLQF